MFWGGNRKFNTIGRKQTPAQSPLLNPLVSASPCSTAICYVLASQAGSYVLRISFKAFRVFVIVFDPQWGKKRVLEYLYISLFLQYCSLLVKIMALFSFPSGKKMQKLHIICLFLCCLLPLLTFYRMSPFIVHDTLCHVHVSIII